MNDIANIQSRVFVDMAEFVNDTSVVKRVVMFWAIRVSFEYLYWTESWFCFNNIVMEIQIFQNFLYLIFLIKIKKIIFWQGLDIDTEKICQVVFYDKF